MTVARTSNPLGYPFDLWRVSVNGTAYTGMIKVNPDGTAGPGIRAGDGEYVYCRDAMREMDRLQARIDALMLEHCPDEMTNAQRENWAKHQRAAPETNEVYDKIGVLRPDGEFTTYEGCDGDPVYIRRTLKANVHAHVDRMMEALTTCDHGVALESSCAECDALSENI